MNILKSEYETIIFNPVHWKYFKQDIKINPDDAKFIVECIEVDGMLFAISREARQLVDSSIEYMVSMRSNDPDDPYPISNEEYAKNMRRWYMDGFSKRKHFYIISITTLADVSEERIDPDLLDRILS